MRCWECFTTWTDIGDFQAHLRAHGVLEAARQARSNWLVRCYNRWIGHDEGSCKCRAVGVRFECEIYKRYIVT